MMGTTTRLRAALIVIMLGGCVGLAAAPVTASEAVAQQAPPAASGQTRPDDQQGSATIPGQPTATPAQPAEDDARAPRHRTMTRVGGVAIGGMLAVLVLFHLIRGAVRIEAGPSGRMIRRFNGFERFAHWLTAICFIVLAVTGLNVSFGRDLLLPLIGADAFAAWSDVARRAHDAFSFPFTLGLLLMLVLWIRDSLPARGDGRWLAAGGGLVGGTRPPARRFSAGQKLVFWSVVLGGVAIAASGAILLFPAQFRMTDAAGMQLALQLHGLVALVMIAIILAHIYFGSLGKEGAFSAMGSGRVDLNWAKEHHSLWVDEMMRAGRPSASLSGVRGLGAD